jgi:amino acid permease
MNINTSNIVLFKFDVNLLISFTVNLLSFTCTQIVFELRDELTEPTIKRTFKVLNRSILVEILLYIFIGLFGYISSLNFTP